MSIAATASPSLASRLRAIRDEVAPEANVRAPRALHAGLAAVALAIAAVLLAGHAHEFTTALARALHADWPLVAVGAALEALSLGGYVLLFHRVVATARLRPRDSYDITLAGSAATRLLPTAGLGGAAVAVWALRARGIRPQEVAERMLAFLLLLYGVYMAALAAAGVAVATGLAAADRGSALGAIGALLGAGIGAGAIAALRAPALVEPPLMRLARQPGRVGAAATRACENLPVLRAALVRAAREVRQPRPALAGAVAWWAFDIGVLATMLVAFGARPDPAVLVLAYFLGTLFNVLPLPGSLSGGLVGMLVALGTPAAPALAAVLAYRTVAVWLPAGAGVASAASLRTSVARWRTEAPTDGAVRDVQPAPPDALADDCLAPCDTAPGACVTLPSAACGGGPIATSHEPPPPHAPLVLAA